MKTLVLSLTLLLAPLLMAEAQYARFGAKGGVGFASPHGTDGSSDYTNYLGVYHAGGIVSYEFVSRIAVQAELLYAQKGFVYEDYSFNQNDEVTGDLRLHYLELPLLFKLQKGGLFAEAGPYAGYLLATNNTFEVSTSGTSPPAFYTSDRLQRFDYGYTVGLGIMLDNGLFMSFRNTGGFRSVTKDLDQKNLDFRLSVGYLLQPPNTIEMMRR
ncbi:PorT family protein [Pontibacter sp. E15-1]|uniref:porin family protein n=1 Tax=Pontibacter sp. E15-1 TaxID=2919918 RepID=UPI001F4F7AF8|nr:porin family protein [Pontibacter sp. E15-1]MCJ8164816.1 PorT family protein [Pontibacter sp. E15-1]